MEIRTAAPADIPGLRAIHDPHSLGTHTTRVSTTRTSVASSRMESVSTSSAAARHRSSISATSSRISCSSSASSSSVRSAFSAAVFFRSCDRDVTPRREAAPPIALAIERVLRRPPNSAPRTAPAPAASSRVRSPLLLS